MNRRIAAPAALLLAALAGACDRTPSGLSARAEGPEFTLGSGTDTFLAGALASYTIHNTTGAWSVVSGQLVADSSAKQSVVTRNGLTIANGFVQTETSATPDGGLVMRFLDKDNYYLLAIRDDSRYGHANVQFHKFLNGVVTSLSSQYNISWPAATTKTARFEASGNTLSAYLDGVLIVQVTDSSFASGGAGLRHNSASGQNLTARYDELVWGGTTSAYYTDPFNDNTLPSYTLYNTTAAWSVASGKASADSSARHSLALRDGLSFADGWVETSSSQIPDGGLVLRVQDSANYYLLAIRDDSRYGHSNIQIYEFNAGIETDLTPQLDISWPASTSKTVRFEASGTTLSAYVDGVLEAQATDGTFSSGGAGLRHNSPSGENLTSRFDLFRWYY
jgi:hypothetical protein